MVGGCVRDCGVRHNLLAQGHVRDIWSPCSSSNVINL